MDTFDTMLDKVIAGFDHPVLVSCHEELVHLVLPYKNTNTRTSTCMHAHVHTQI